jgi:hypothetical protein
MIKLPQKSRKSFQGRTVKLIDGSIFMQAGNSDKKGGKSIRLHMCYNLTAGRMNSVLLTDNRTAESVHVCNINAGEIIIADAGFGKGKSLAHVVSLNADALFRATPSNLKLALDARGKVSLNMAEKLSTATENILDFCCFVHTENNKYHPVRVVASRLPEEKALLAKQRKKRYATKKQVKIKDETLLFAEWVFLITSLGDEYSPEQLLEMYRSRWQIELLFKRIKQSFNVQKLPPATLKHSAVMVTLWLILWALAEKQSLAIEMFLIDKETDMNKFSTWAMQSFLLFQLKAFISYLWASSISIDTDFCTVFQRLLNHHSRRRNHYAFFHFACS